MMASHKFLKLVCVASVVIFCSACVAEPIYSEPGYGYTNEGYYGGGYYGYPAAYPWAVGADIDIGRGYGHGGWGGGYGGGWRGGGWRR